MSEKTQRGEKAPQKFTGTLFLAYLGGLEKLGLTGEVKARVPPEVAKLMERPPLPTQWMSGSELAAMLTVVQQLRGLEGVRDVAYEANRLSIWKVLNPLLQNTLKLYGGGPETLFTHLDTICRPLFQALRFSYVAQGPREGTVSIRSEYRMAAPSWAAWEGSLRLIFDAAGVKGTVGASAVREGGHVADVKVSW